MAATSAVRAVLKNTSRKKYLPNKIMQEKRKYPRIASNLPITLSDCGWDAVTETKNISASGACCAVNKPLEIMTKLSIRLLVPSGNPKKKAKEVHCEGVVVRKEHVRDNGKFSYRVAIYFNALKEEDRKILLSYIDSHLKHPA